jgi:hypothetical protein
MKKVALLSIVLILLAVLVVPVMAKGPSNGHGNGVSASPGNPSGSNSGDNDKGGQQNQDGQQNHGNAQNQERNANSHGNGNGNQEQSRMRTPFYLQGTIKAINLDTKTITVTLTQGNAQVKQYIGGDLTLQATVTTLIFKINQGDENETESGESAAPAASSPESENSGETDSNRVVIPFEQLAVGQKVAIHGNLVNGIYTARLITVYIRTPVGESAGG